MRRIEFLILILLASILALATTARGEPFDDGAALAPSEGSVLRVMQTTGPQAEFPALAREFLLPPEVVERWKERERLREERLRDLKRRQFDERSELEILRLLAVNACDWAGAADLARRAELLARRHRRRLRRLEDELDAKERRARHEELSRLNLRPWIDALRGPRTEGPRPALVTVSDRPNPCYSEGTMHDASLPVPAPPADPVAGTMRCPVCASPFRPDEAIRRCERCDTPHHVDCWDYVGHCAVFGCQPGETRPAVTEEEFHGLRRSLDRWLWSYRLYSIVLALCGPSLALVFLSPMGLFILSRFIESRSTVDLYLVFHALVSLSFLVLGLAVVGLGLPMVLARRRLAGLLTCAPPRRKEEARLVLDRLELDGPSGWLHGRLVALGPGLDRIVFVGQLALVAVICLLFVAPLPMGSLFPFWAIASALLFLVVIVGFFFGGPLQAARDRLSYLATVQNRSALGWKGKG